MISRFFLAAALGAAVALAGCSDDSGRGGGTSSGNAMGLQGHSCEFNQHCATGLACIDYECTLVDFGLPQTGKMCSIVECSAALDCCPTPMAECESWAIDCAMGDPNSCIDFDDPGHNCTCNGSLLSCIENQCEVLECNEAADCCGPEPPQCASAEANCLAGDQNACDFLNLPNNGCCDESAWLCQTNACIPTCADDGDCVAIGGVCQVGLCVECKSSADCGPKDICADNGCVTQCISDGDCSTFYQCQAGECVDVGCQTTMECVAMLTDVDAMCVDTRCLLPCQTDADCADPSSFDFQVCLDSVCTIQGCETDQECRLRLGVGPATGFDALCMVAE